MKTMIRHFLTAVTFAGTLALSAASDAEQLLIAIVDDGFRVTHTDLASYIWTNPKEIPGNRVDDDGNGFVDDIVGWDIADGDQDVSPPIGREEEFYHGTHVAGLIIQVVEQFLEEEALDRIKILPVKCLEDNAEKMYLKSGYKGIQYAVDAGADIILTAWGMSTISPNEMRILQNAQDKGCMIICAAGNMYADLEQFPAAFPYSVAVGAVQDNGIKLSNSSYGSYVDLLARGEAIKSASSRTDVDYEIHSGTSQSAAIVAGAAAVLKLTFPDARNEEISALLKNTAIPVEARQGGELFFGGKLGAGMVNLPEALRYDLNKEPSKANYELKSHQGYIPYYRPADHLVIWRIRPHGEVKGFWFEPKLLSGDPGKTRLQIFQPERDEPFLDLALKQWNEKLFVPGTQAMALLVPDPEHSDYKFLGEYSAAPIKQSTLYCEGLIDMEKGGILEDGSGSESYSPQTDCKWLITAPPGKAIHIEFLEFDTEASTDWVYFFNGAGTHEKTMAVYSGPKIPPELTSWSNQMLIWFVTDEKVQGKGWKAVVSFVDPVPVTED